MDEACGIWRGQWVRLSILSLPPFPFLFALLPFVFFSILPLNLLFLSATPPFCYSFALLSALSLISLSLSLSSLPIFPPHLNSFFSLSSPSLSLAPRRYGRHLNSEVSVSLQTGSPQFLQMKALIGFNFWLHEATEVKKDSSSSNYPFWGIPSSKQLRLS